MICVPLHVVLVNAYCLWSILMQKRGTFLEAGAYNGEEASVTLGLELHHGWTGILVEPVPWIFSQLKDKCRRATLLQGCISPEKTPIKVLTQDVTYFLRAYQSSPT
jgi:hypothetical protein